MASPDEMTIADVARAAGVSVSTVSRVLNDKQDVGAETRLRVQQTIDKLGFTPHASAQRLRANKTSTLALLYPLSSVRQSQLNQLELDLLMGTADAAGQNGYIFTLLTKPVTRHDLLNLYRSSQVDGVVLMQIHLRDWRVDLLRHHGLPFAIVGRCEDNTGVNFIDFDFEAAVQAEFDHLIGQGHRRIALLGYPHQTVEQGFGPAVRTLAGYERALQRHDLERIYREVPFNVNDISEATLRLLNEDPRLTAIVTAHDLSTVGVLRAAAACGLRIPEDLSVVTLIPERMSNLTNPPLTGPDFPSNLMGQRAAEMLIQVLNGPHSEPQQIILPPHLAVRGSTGLARSIEA